MTKPKNWPVHPAKTQISLGIRPVWSVSSLSAWRKHGSLATHWVHSKDSDQTGRMPRLTWAFARRTCHFVDFVMLQLIYNITTLQTTQTYLSAIPPGCMSCTKIPDSPWLATTLNPRDCFSGLNSRIISTSRPWASVSITRCSSWSYPGVVLYVGEVLGRTGDSGLKTGLTWPSSRWSSGSNSKSQSSSPLPWFIWMKRYNGSRQANLCLRAFHHDKFQLRMPSHSEGPGIWLSVWRFLLTHCLYERVAEVLARLRG